MGIKIVSDSSSNVLKIDGFNYTTVPLKISFDGKEYVDDENCDVYGMVNALKEYAENVLKLENDEISLFEARQAFVEDFYFYDLKYRRIV